MYKIKQIFYDSPESGRWINRIDVLYIERDHRRILNAQPMLKERFYITENYETYCSQEPEIIILHDFKTLSN